jgi:exopolysaccharide biosynthesis protein
LRAWKISSGSVSVEIHKVAYGSKITQNFVKGNGENQDRGMDVSSKTVTYQPVCDIAIISCSPTQITFGVSKQLLGTDKGDVEDMAQKTGALVAVNGEATDEYATDHSTIRSGKVYVTSTSIRHSPFVRMYRNGTWNTGDIDYTNQDQLIKDGVYNSVRHQGTPLWDGKLTGTNDDTYYHNRTMLAQISANKYILAVGEFMPIASMASLLKAYGAKNAILLNGGNCSFMYAKGVGNVTGTKASLLKNLNKINVVETEFFASNGMLGLNSSGKQKLGGPDEEIDIVYVK